MPESNRKMIVDIHHAGTLAKNLMQHLLAFGRRQVVQPVFLDWNTTVNHTAKMLNRLIGDDVELISVLGRDLGTLKADPSPIEQVLMNLANACTSCLTAERLPPRPPT